MAEALNEDPGFNCAVLSTADTSLKQQWRAVRKAHVVHTNSTALPLVLLCRLARKPVLLKLHYPQFRSARDERNPATPTSRIVREVRRILVDATRERSPRSAYLGLGRLGLRLIGLHLVTQVVACSLALAQSTEIYRTVSFLPNPVPALDEIPGSREVDAATFCFVGRLVKEKGPQFLLEAANNLIVEGAAVQVVIAGTGPLEGELHRRVSELGIEGNVQMLGKVDHEQIRSIYQQAIALVFPIAWEDPAPYPPLEAAAEGRVTVACDRGGLPETAGPHAYYFESESVNDLTRAMSDVLRNPAAALDRGAMAREYAAGHYAPSVSSSLLGQTLARLA
ncbi:glycosyltransferase family 4 protein [Nocardioides sp. 31GB23]|uniref:glycosyltransferase family 4 protein n=1 Tax=Nocardioides sp. 31GB23 TaxID=3156065 RepID=UPI0032AF8BF1